MERALKWLVWATAGTVLVASAGCPRPQQAPVERGLETVERGLEEMTEAELVDRGAYLVQITGCMECHTPRDEEGQPIEGLELTGHPPDAPLPEWDPSMLERNVISTGAPTGTAFAGPFGVSVAGNLTPDEETGTGRLTAETLIESWRTGESWKEDRPILPPMPAFTQMTELDIVAIHAYLMSLEPVHNPTPPSEPAIRE